MAARIVFTGGASVVVTTTDAAGILNNLARVAEGGLASEHGRQLPPGVVDVHTDEGVRYVYAAQVAYVHDVSGDAPEDMPGAEQTDRPSLHELR